MEDKLNPPDDKYPVPTVGETIRRKRGRPRMDKTLGVTLKTLDRGKMFLAYYLDPKKEEYMNSYSSAIKAGYSRRVAEQLSYHVTRGRYKVIKQGIDEYRKKVQEEVTAENTLTPELVMGILKECCEVASNPALIESWPKDYRHYYPTVLRGVELAGKYLKMFEDKQVNLGIQIVGLLPGESVDAKY